MTVTPIGLFFLAMYAGILLCRPAALPWGLAVSVPFSHTAVFVLGSSGVSPFFLGAILCGGRLVVLLGRRRQGPRTWRLPRVARVPLVIFAGYATVITLLGPAIFQGVAVLTPRGGIDDQIGYEASLTYTISNVAQLIYLVLGVSVALYLVAEEKVSFRVFELSIWIGVLAAFADYLLGSAWPSTLIDNNPATHYDIFSARVRGTFPEPSVFGLFLGASISYLVAAFPRATSKARIGYVILLALAGIEFVVADSATSLVALSIVGAVALILFIVRAIGAGSAGVVRLAVVISLGAGALIAFGAYAFDLVDDRVVAKSLSESYEYRSLANDVAASVFDSSFGIGVGLGSNRPSSLYWMLLSCVGVVGTLAFALFIGAILVRGLFAPNMLGTGRFLDSRPVQWALLATILSQIAAKPDLSIPTMWLLVGLALRAISRSEPVQGRLSASAPPVLVGGASLTERAAAAQQATKRNRRWSTGRPPDQSPAVEATAG